MAIFTSMNLLFFTQSFKGFLHSIFHARYIRGQLFQSVSGFINFITKRHQRVNYFNIIGTRNLSPAPLASFLTLDLSSITIFNATFLPMPETRLKIVSSPRTIASCKSSHRSWRQNIRRGLGPITRDRDQKLKKLQLVKS